MSRHHRLLVPGGTYYLTACLADPSSQLLTERIGLLRDVVRLTQRQLPFEIDCAVILPSELHMIWLLPEGDTDLVSRWRMLKSTFARHVPETLFEAASRRRHLKREIWHRKFWDHLIQDQADLEAHRTQALMAPVRAGLATEARAWPFSSIHHRPAEHLPVRQATAPQRVA